jgi:hypothetical protein
MDTKIFIGTNSGLWTLDGETSRQIDAFAGQSVTALARDDTYTWALVDSSTPWREHDGAWTQHATLSGPAATCLAPSADGLLIGTEQAHLYRLTDAGPARINTFDTMDGRDAWYTPWGDPADVRSIAVAREGTIHVNVHVGGVARSRDGGASWAPTIDIEQDVHQVLAHPRYPRVVLVASAEGFGISRDGGDSWTFATGGLHAHYSRAVAVGDAHVLLSASTGPRGRRSAIYRTPLEAATRFEHCRDGLPEWFDDNIDTSCLVAAGALVVFGTADGRLYRSRDDGAHWELALKGLPRIACVAVG